MLKQEQMITDRAVQRMLDRQCIAIANLAAQPANLEYILHGYTDCTRAEREDAPGSLKP